MRMLSFAFLAATASAASTADRTVAKNLSPNYYKDSETPQYITTNYGIFEERTYPAGLRMACMSKVAEWDERSDFMVVAGYIFGGNDQKMKIPMTSPVITKKEPLGDGSRRVVRTMCFYLGSRFDDDEPPAPTDPRVEISKSEQLTVYTRKKPGFMNPSSWANEKAELEAIVKNAGLPFETDHYYQVGYDAPFTLTDRRNEIWLVKKESP